MHSQLIANAGFGLLFGMHRIDRRQGYPQWRPTVSMNVRNTSNLSNASFHESILNTTNCESNYEPVIAVAGRTSKADTRGGLAVHSNYLLSALLCPIVTANIIAVFAALPTDHI